MIFRIVLALFVFGSVSAFAFPFEKRGFSCMNGETLKKNGKKDPYYSFGGHADFSCLVSKTDSRVAHCTRKAKIEDGTELDELVTTIQSLTTYYVDGVGKTRTRVENFFLVKTHQALKQDPTVPNLPDIPRPARSLSECHEI